MPFDFENKDYISVSYDDIGFTGEYLTASEYVEKMGRFQPERIFECNDFHYVQVRSFN